MKKIISGLIAAVLAAGCMNLDPCISESLKEVGKIKYAEDAEGEDYLQTTEETLALGTGDCADMILLLQDKLMKKGIKTKDVVGRLEKDSEKFHAWLEYRDEKGMVWILDPAEKVYVRKDKKKENEYSIEYGSIQSFFNWRKRDREGK